MNSAVLWPSSLLETCSSSFRSTSTDPAVAVGGSASNLDTLLFTLGSAGFLASAARPRSEEAPGQILPWGGSFPSSPREPGPSPGEIRLGFVVSQGWLLVEILRARNCRWALRPSKKLLTYVKVELLTCGQVEAIRKTPAVRVKANNPNPQFQTQLKIPAAQVTDRCKLLVSVFYKVGFLAKKNFLGCALIRFSELDLKSYNSAWYAMFEDAYISDKELSM